MSTVCSVNRAKRQIHQLLRQKRIVGITRHSELEAFLVPKERMEMLLETMETLANRKAMRAVRDFQAGRLKFRSWESVKRELREA